MKKIIYVISIIGLLIIFSNNINSNNYSSTKKNINSTINKTQNINNEKNENDSSIKNKICDGIKITENCEYEGKIYQKFIYHPNQPEKYHYKEVTNYKKEVVGYCTLCKDGTYSPTCATGRGACSHHGGVAQWNAPIYKSVPYTEKIKVIDSPYIPEHYEKVEKDN